MQFFAYTLHIFVYFLAAATAVCVVCLAAFFILLVLDGHRSSNSGP
jgi:hypothetical protein